MEAGLSGMRAMFSKRTLYLSAAAVGIIVFVSVTLLCARRRGRPAYRVPGTALGLAEACRVLELEKWTFEDDQTFYDLGVRLVTYAKPTGRLRLLAYLMVTGGAVDFVDLGAYGPFPGGKEELAAATKAHREMLRTADLLFPSCREAVSRAIVTGHDARDVIPRFTGTATSLSGWRVTYVAFKFFTPSYDSNPYEKLIFDRVE